MASLAHVLAARHLVSFGVRIEVVRRSAAGWWLDGGEAGFGPFDALVIALPAEQAAPLLAMLDLELAREAVICRSLPCWSMMAGFAEPLAGLPDYLRGSEAISWAARNSSKPGRPPGESWVIQASPDWSQRHLGVEAETVAQRLLGEWRALGHAVAEPTFLKARRWRFALTTGSHDTPLWKPELALGACGDWRAGPRIEDAWLSGARLADRMVASLLAEGSGGSGRLVVQEA
jgi:predicted NAD/FAD-dependent oxidoreductase